MTCSSEEDEDSFASGATGEALPFVNPVQLEPQLQAFLDEYVPEVCVPAPQSGSNDWIENPLSDDDDDDVLCLIDIRKHYTTPTEGLLGAEDGGSVETPGPSTRNALPWSSSQEQQLIQWQRFQSTLPGSLKSWWSGIDDEGNKIGAVPEEQHASHSIPHSMSVDRDLSALWTADTEGIFALDDNENPVNLEEHAQSWPRHHSFMGVHGNKPWLSRPEEVITCPNDWIAGDSGDASCHSLLPCEIGNELATNNNTDVKPYCPLTKHWSLGDQDTEESLLGQVKRLRSLQDTDLLKRRAQDPNDGCDGLGATWMNSGGLAFSDVFSGERSTCDAPDSHVLTPTSVDLSSLGCMLPDMDDVFRTEDASDDPSPEVR